MKTFEDKRCDCGGVSRWRGDHWSCFGYSTAPIVYLGSPPAFTAWLVRRFGPVEWPPEALPMLVDLYLDQHRAAQGEGT